MVRVLFVVKEMKMEHLGVMYLLDSLRLAGHEARLVRCDTPPDPMKVTKDWKPEFLAYSVCSGLEDFYFDLDQKLAEVAPRSWVLFGGPSVTFSPERFMDYSMMFNRVGYFIRGEGEDSVVAAVERREFEQLKLVDIQKLPIPDRGELYKYDDLRNNPIKNIITRRGCRGSCSYCAPPNSLVFMADSTTRRAGDIKVGDMVLGFEKQNESGKPRKFVESEVIAVNHREADIVQGIFEDGSSVLCTADHRWFTGRNFRELIVDDRDSFSMRVVHFMDPPVPPVKDSDYWRGWLRGVAAGDGCLTDTTKYHRPDGDDFTYASFRLVKPDEVLIDTFIEKSAEFGVQLSKFRFEQKERDVVMAGKVYCLRACSYPGARTATKEHSVFFYEDEVFPSTEYMKGWIAGIIDTDGCLSGRLLSISQKEGPVLDRLVEFMRGIGFDPVIDSYDQDDVQGVCRVRLLGGVKSAVRLIATVHPILERKRKFLPGISVYGTKKKLLEVRPWNKGEVVSFTTSSETYISQGFLSHNCFNREWNHLHATQLPRGIIRYRTVDDVIQEAVQIRSLYPVEMINFVDDNFASDLGWLHEFSQQWKVRVGLPYFCSVKPDDVSQMIVDLLKVSGCVIANMAVESANDENRRRVLTRSVDKEMAVEAIRMFAAAGIRTRLQNIIGLPVKRPMKDALETLRFNIRAKPTSSWCALLQAYRGTKIHEIASAGGYIDKDNDMTDPEFFGHSTLKIKGKKKIERLHKLWPLLTAFPRLNWIRWLLLRLPLPYRCYRWVFDKSKKWLAERDLWKVNFKRGENA